MREPSFCGENQTEYIVMANIKGFSRNILVAGAAALVLASVGISTAQNTNKFKARLAPAPSIAVTAPGTSLPRGSTAGIGSATATLAGRKLSVEGKFEKLASSATEAHLFIGPAAGARGTSIFDLMVSPGNAGTLTGSVDLSPEHVDALRKGRLYIQIHSQGAPNGHLLGWLLAEK
jgi:hypothetical protein